MKKVTTVLTLAALATTLIARSAGAQTPASLGANGFDPDLVSQIQSSTLSNESTSDVQPALNILNYLRTASGLSPLTVDPTLTLMARYQAEDQLNRMYSANYTELVSGSAIAPTTMATDFGLNDTVADGVGSNASMYGSSVAISCYYWGKSSFAIHPALMDPNNTVIGIAVVNTPYQTTASDGVTLLPVKNWTVMIGKANPAAAPVNQAPTVGTAAAASPATVTGTTTQLSALGADDGGESNLTYTWATTGTPPAAVTFSANGTNAAKNTTATFTQAGTYNFQVTITDGGGLTTTSSVTVTVQQTVTNLTVSPTAATVLEGATQSFTTSATDQFGNAVSGVTPTWTATDGSVSGAGLFTAGTTTGTGQLTATVGTAQARATLTVNAPPATSVITIAPAPIAKTAVYRLFNNATLDHFYTASTSEDASSVATGGYSDEGIIGYAPTNAGSNTTSLYRFYNAGTGEHFYTTSAAEAGLVAATGIWTPQGVAFQLLTSSGSNEVPYYRLYIPFLFRHLYTTNPAEVSYAVANGANLEGTIGYLYAGN